VKDTTLGGNKKYRLRGMEKHILQLPFGFAEWILGSLLRDLMQQHCAGTYDIKI